MSKTNVPDWQDILRRAQVLPEPAYQFVRDGLQHTVRMTHGEEEGEKRPRHITGQQLCIGLRDLAVTRWGHLAGTVLRRWGLRCTEDFGVIVYALIERGEMRNSPEDSFDDFKGVYEFEEVFASPAAMAR